MAQYRMSPERAQDFAEKVTAVVRDLGEQMIPELFAVRGDDV